MKFFQLLNSISSSYFLPNLSQASVICSNPAIEMDEDMPDKLKLDMLINDINYIILSIAKNLGIARIKINDLMMDEYYYRQLDDVIFWDAIEHGIRLISSGWDRISL